MYRQEDNLVIGTGEIGTAIKNVLGCEGIDKGESKDRDYKVVHICYPPSQKFVDITDVYIAKYNPELIVIHSTVPIGTTDTWDIAVHSPVRGVHPHLETGIRTFVKYFGGKKAGEASQIFAEKGVKTKIVKDARTSEALKIFDTTQYGLQIMIEKEIYRYCKENDLDFEDVYQDANKTYNAGYMELGRPEVVRPWLRQMDGKVGGHCVMENLPLIDWWLARLLEQQNDTY